MAESGSQPEGGVSTGGRRSLLRRARRRYDVFISYAHADGVMVEEVIRELKKRRVRVWFDQMMEGGTPWIPELELRIKEIGVAAVFIGPSGFGEWHEQERWLTHLEKNYIIPVLLPGLPEDFKPSGFLAGFHQIDLRSGITPETLGKLVRAIREGRRVRSKALEVRKPSTQAGSGSAPNSGPGWWRRLRLVISFFLLALPTLAFLVLHGDAFGVRQPPAPIPESLRRHARVPLPRYSVVVLTFENRSRLPDLDWLSTALAEAVAAQLGAGDAVRVVDRQEVVLAETDLLLSSPKMEVQARDLESLRHLLGTDFVVSGAYEAAGPAGVRLELALHDARAGRRVAESRGEGKETAWLDLARTEPLRQAIVALPSIPGSGSDLRALFPTSLAAAKPYFEGLSLYRRDDVEGARDLFVAAIDREPRPLMLASLAKAKYSLGLWEEADQAIVRAMELDGKARGTPLALPPRYRAEIQILGKRNGEDPKKAAEAAERFFREYFPDDVSYGLTAVDALVDANLKEEAWRLLQEIRGLPLADQNLRIDLAEAGILMGRRQYLQARSSALKGLTRARVAGVLRREAEAHLLLASIASSKGETLQADRLYRQAQKGFDRVGDSHQSVRSLEGLALMYVNHDLPMAEKHYSELTQKYRELGESEQQARALFGLSAVHTLRGDLTQAQACAEEAGRLAGESSGFYKALAEFDIGTILHFAGRLSEASERYETTRVLLGDPPDDPHLLAFVLTGLGEIEYMRGSFGQARILLEQGRKGYFNVKDLPGEASAEVLLGRVSAAIGNFSDARDRFNRAKARLDSAATGSSPESETFVEALLASAELELDSGRSDLAMEAAGRAEDVAEGVGLNNGQSRALALQARVFLRQGRRVEAGKAAAKAVDLARGDFRAVREAKLAEARVRAASGQVKPALGDIERISRETAHTGELIYRFESLLARGTIELENGRVHQGHRLLQGLRAEVEGLGFDRMVRSVDTALGEISSERVPAR
jgi:tetratricopeptide (TPR) repeat protein/TolB-like protein